MTLARLLPRGARRYLGRRLIRVEPDLQSAERQGIELAIVLRSITILAVLAFITPDLVSKRGNFSGLAMGLAFLGVGLAYLWMVRAGHERQHHRIMLLTLDVAIMTAVAAVLACPETVRLCDAADAQGLSRWRNLEAMSLRGFDKPVPVATLAATGERATRHESAVSAPLP